jgi:hypothetical protein
VKKLLKILSAAVISTAFMGSMASAATCDGVISVTGPGSNNQISCNDVRNIVVTCTNNIWVGNVNDQDATSGSGSVTGNTTGGNVATGEVVNNNGNDVTIGAHCGPAATTVSTPGVGSAGGEGGGGAGEAGGPAVLPFTAATPAAFIAAGSLAAAAGVTALSRLVVAAYRRVSIK